MVHHFYIIISFIVPVGSLSAVDALKIGLQSVKSVAGDIWNAYEAAIGHDQSYEIVSTPQE
jgi:hypothetical protein